MPLDDLDLKLTMLNGAAVIDTGTVRSGPIAYNAAGRIDFIARQMDVILTPSARAPKAGVERRGPAAPSKPGDGIVLRGPWEQPKIFVDDVKRASSQ